MAEQSVANALTTSQFLGIAGAFLAVVLEVRLGRLLPLAIGIIGGAASIYLLVGDGDGDGDMSANRHWIGVCGFNFLWNLSMPYMLATLADFDLRGRMVVHGVSMQFIGVLPAAVRGRWGSKLRASSGGQFGRPPANGRSAERISADAAVDRPALLLRLWWRGGRRGMAIKGGPPHINNGF